jgi:hypothetical protein
MGRFVTRTFLALIILSWTAPGIAAPLAAADAEGGHAIDIAHHIRNNCASLLYDLLNDEKNVSKILIIKRESPELHELVKTIAKSASEGVRTLEHLAKEDRTLELKVTGLPSGEAATRKSVSKGKESELLHSKGGEFEFELLLTQVEALNYGAHLAQVAAENEARPESAREFSALAEEFNRLHGRVVDLLRTRREVQ